MQRYQCFEIELARLLGGWLPGIETWEIKHRVGSHLWEDAQHSREIRTRLWELRKPNPDKRVQGEVFPIFERLALAQYEYEFIAGMYLVVKQDLLVAYQQFIKNTFEVYDSPSIPMLQKIIADKKAQIGWAKELLARVLRSGEESRQTKRWVQFIRDVVDFAGGVDGHQETSTQTSWPEPPPGYALLLPFAEAKRDGQFEVNAGGSQMPADDNRLEQTVWQFMNYGQEMQAAETIGSVMWETNGMPWEFYYDLARHCWDEVRHVQLGENRLAELGYHISDFPQAVGNFAWRQLLDPLRRYCLLTYVIEADSFDFKHKTYRQYIEDGDIKSAEAVLFDIMDETLHVRWGKKWVPELMKKYEYEASARDLEEECRAILVKHSLAPQQILSAKEKAKQIDSEKDT